MINVLTIGAVCENQTESLVYRLQGLGFNDCLVALHHLELCHSPFNIQFIRGNRNVKHSDEPIARRSILPLATRHGDEAGGTSKTDEGVARSC